MENIETIADIDKIVFAVRNNISDGFFFIPWVGKNYEEGLKGKRVLVVGASHYCNHSNFCKNSLANNACSNFYNKELCKLGCDNFQECTGGTTSKFNGLCKWMNLTEYSSRYEYLCKLIDDKLSGTKNITCKLESTTLGEVCNFLDQDCSNCYSFTKFTNFNEKYFGVDKEALWKHLAFANFAQNFQPASTGNSFVPSDYTAFNKYVELLKPNVVIVWGDVGNELYNCEFKKDTYFYDYLWKDKDVTYIHTYHPSYSGYEHQGKLDQAMNKVFEN